MDFRNVSRLFAEPNRDGSIKIDDNFKPDKKTKPSKSVDNEGDEDKTNIGSNIKPVIDKNGCRVEIIHKIVSIYDTKGNLLRHEGIVDYTKENIKGEYATLDAFIREWRNDTKKDKIKNFLLEHGIDIEKLKVA